MNTEAITNLENFHLRRDKVKARLQHLIETVDMSQIGEVFTFVNEISAIQHPSQYGRLLALEHRLLNTNWKTKRT